MQILREQLTREGRCPQDPASKIISSFVVLQNRFSLKTTLQTTREIYVCFIFCQSGQKPCLSNSISLTWLEE